MEALLQRITLYGRWFSNLRLIVAAIVLVLLMLSVIYCLPFDAELRVRVAGLCFELLGLFAVAKGLRERIVFFNYQGFFSKWWDRRPWRSIEYGYKAVSDVNSVGVGESSSVSISPPTGTLTVEGRLAIVEGNLDHFRTRLDETNEKVRELEEILSDRMALERKARDFETTKIQAQVETLGIGSVHVEEAGVLCLLAGLVLSSMSQEIAAMFDIVAAQWCR
jgi:hypothetical protein